MVDRIRAQELIRKGDACRANSDWQTAVDYYELALAEDPENEQAWEGCEAALRGQAMARFRPWNVWFFSLLADLYLRAGMHQQAIRYLGALSAARPHSGILAKKLGQALAAAGSKARALRTYHRALQIRSEDRQLLRQAAELADELADVEKACDYWTRLARLLPSDQIVNQSAKNAQAARYQHNASEDLDDVTRRRQERERQELEGQSTAAREAQIRQLITQYRQEPDNFDLPVQAARLLFDIDRAETAIQVLESVLKRAPDNRDALLLLADSHHQAGDFDQAIARYEQLLATQGEFVEWRLQIAHMRLEQAEDARASQPDDEQAAAAHQQILAALKELLVQQARENLSRQPGDPDLLLELGHRLCDAGHSDQAIEHYQLAMQNPGRKFLATKALGQAYLQMGRLPLAEETLRTALQLAPPNRSGVLSPDEKDVHYALGETLLRLADVQQERGDQFDAQETRRKAVDCFKKVYQSDVRYRDVKRRYEALIEQVS